MRATTGRRSFLTACGLAAAAAARPLAAFGQAVDNAKQASSPSALRITELKCGYVRGSLFVKVHANQGTPTRAPSSRSPTPSPAAATLPTT